MTIDPNAVPTALLPCPFCGSTDIATDGPSYTLFMCNECGGQTYDQDSHAEAIAAWNHRAPTAMQPDGLEVVAWAYRGPKGGLIALEAWPDHAPEAEPLVHQSKATAHITRLEADVARLTKERDAAQERFMDHVDYGIDLACIIEALCSFREVPVPKTTARYHYDMAVRAEAQNKAMREAGAQLANCAYNLSQPSQAMRLEERTRATLKECCEAWDRATLSSIKATP